jgi:hypothetical protein
VAALPASSAHEAGADRPVRIIRIDHPHDRRLVVVVHRRAEHHRAARRNAGHPITLTTA